MIIVSSVGGAFMHPLDTFTQPLLRGRQGREGETRSVDDPKLCKILHTKLAPNTHTQLAWPGIFSLMPPKLV